jgi:hypothetical protein
MKRLAQKTKGLVKGTPVAVLVSIGIHALLIFAAIGWVVFQITKPEEVKFVPVEKIERPVMKLKKLQVKVQKDARPKQTPERISTETPKVISDIVLPEMTGSADGLGAGPIGGFEMMEELSKMTLLGGGKSIGNDLVGTYYYFIQKRNGAPSGLTVSGTAPWPGGPVQSLIRDFFAAGWDPSLFDPYWRAPMKLHATQLFVPPVISTLAPDKFGDDRPVEAALWVVHYKGKIAYPEGGRFRFWGYADDLLFVRINGETVLDASHAVHLPGHLADWSSSADENVKYQVGFGRYRVGDWFEMNPDEPVDMEVLVGELPGGTFAAMLCVEQEGVEYPEREFGGPLLPIFKTAPPPPHIIDEMSFTLPEGHVDFEGGPIFSVY